MNQRLVDSVAQIVLAMTEDERRLLERKLQGAGLRHLSEPTGSEKSLRVAELAQDIQDFEALYHSPLSALSVEHWMVDDSSSPHSSAADQSLTEPSLPAPAESGQSEPSTQHSPEEQSPSQLQAVLPLTQATKSESDHTDYALYEETHSQNGWF